MMFSRRLFAIVLGVTWLAVSGGTAVAPPAAEAAFPGENGLIVFNRGSDMFVMNADGSGERSLGRGLSPEWSPDGGKLVFSDVTTPGTLQIVTMNADGSDRQTLITGVAQEPSWSPDGSRITYLDRASPGDQSLQVYVMDADGSNVQKLTDFFFIQDSGRPSWSPDGTKILFSGQEDQALQGWELYTISPDGTNLQQVTDTPIEVDANILHYELQPDWSPDGSKITFLNLETGATDGRDVYVMNADGSGRQNVTPDTVWEDRPSWSPDGDKIAFAAPPASDIGDMRIQISNADGSGRQVFGPGRDPDWQPIGGVCPGTAAAHVAPLSATTDDDTDGDNIPDNIENNVTHTDPNCQDTDGDGLLDPWEVRGNVEGAGFDLDNDGTPEVSRYAVFRPYAGQCGPEEFGPRREPNGQLCDLVHEPDPLHKDVYVELDWQDCTIDDCPELVGAAMDPSHHAPSMDGLENVVEMFAQAPVENPDDQPGINLHVLVDEGIAHAHNCDQGSSEARPEKFGTATQRGNAQVMEAREKVFRYAWSGHSSLYATPAECPLPEFWEIMASGAGLHPLPEYDVSPPGFATPRGRDVLVTLAVSWICQLYTFDAAPIPQAFGNFPPCFRSLLPPAPGLFPADIALANGGSVEVEQPLHVSLGVPPSQGVVQLWGRTFAHYLGLSLGVPVGQLGNNPNTTGAQLVQSYGSWTGLALAPSDAGPSQLLAAGGEEPIMPDFSLAEQDQDGDGVAENDDNCPGIENPDQADTDLDGTGDTCDQDADGDEVLDEDDNKPGDTDNDGTPNNTDGDDDNDGAPDGQDNCPTMANADQADSDADLAGDACDGDRDGDGLPDFFEEEVGTDPDDPLGTPEFTGNDDSCSDGTDNDNDGDTDAADDGCSDGDGDTVPDSLDNCPDVPLRNVVDSDADGIGDGCEHHFADVSCDDEVGAPDALALLMHLADVGDGPACGVIGAGAPVAFGDADCNGTIEPGDAMAILAVAGEAPVGCLPARRE